MTTIRASDLDAIEELGKDLLPSRTPLIEDGRLHGHHWFVAIVSEAKSILLRKKAWEARANGYRT